MYSKLMLTIAGVVLLSTVSLAQTVMVVQDNAKTPKKPGVIRIGIATPAADMGKDFATQDTPMALRNTLSVGLTDENVETVFLESAMPDREAKQKECDYVFYSKVTRKKGGGGFGSMAALGGLAGMAGMIPGVGIAGAIASSAASTAISVASISGGFKSKDEVAFEYSLNRADGAVVIPATASKQKAKKDGEDILTPQIRTATTNALSQVVKPK